MRITLVFIFSVLCISSYGISVTDSVQLQNRVLFIDTCESLTPIQRIDLRQKLVYDARALGHDESWVINKVAYYLAHDFSRIGDFDRAIEIGTNYRTYYSRIGDTYNYVWACNDLAIFHTNANRYHHSLSLFQEVLRIATQHKFTDLIVDLKDGIASSLLYLGRTEEAKIYIDQVDNVFSTITGQYAKETKMYFFVTKARYFEKVSEAKSAILFYEKAVVLANELNHRKGIYARIRLSSLYLDKQDYRKSLEVSLDLLKQLKLVENPEFKDSYLMNGYHILAYAYQKIGQNDSALYYVRQSEKQYAFFHNQYVFDQSKLFHDKDRRANLALGAEVAFDIYQNTNQDEYLIQALLFSSRAKSNVLNSRLNVNRNVHLKSISEETRNLHFKWVYQLNAYESNGNTAKAVKLRNSLDSLDQSLGLRNNKTFDEQSIRDIQQKLTSNQLLIEYLITDNTLYSFTITKDKISATQKTFVLTEDIMSLYKMLKNSNTPIEEFTSLSSRLYKVLIPSEVKSYSEIIIIPDGVLYFLPFDVLLKKKTTEPSWGNLPYLAKSHTLSYDFSLQTMSEELNYTYTSSFAGFAPRFDNNAALTYLKGGEEVVRQGYDAFGGSTYLNLDASSSNLRSLGVNSEILQLYTHAISSDSSYDASYIYLADKKMYVDEIMTLPLRSKLCLLTACEVGLGKSYSGEGVTGVAWAFKAAGAQNVVQSLWRINQESSATLMQDFFLSLSDNQSSTAALKFAKLSYLNNPDVSERLKHPYYWAGMSHFGPGTTINKKSNYNWLLIGVIGLFTAFLGAKGISKLRNRRTTIH